MKRIIVILILVGIFLWIFHSFQEESSLLTILERMKEMGEEALEKGEKEALPVLQEMWGWFKVNISSKVENWISPEFEKRKQILQESFNQEKESVKDEIKTEILPEVTGSFWEKIKSLIK